MPEGCCSRPTEPVTSHGFKSRNEWFTHRTQSATPSALAHNEGRPDRGGAARGATPQPVRAGQHPAPPSGRTFTLPPCGYRESCRHITTASGQPQAGVAIVTFSIAPPEHQIATRTPSSTTRSDGMRKNSVAGTALRARTRNSQWRHQGIFGTVAGTSTSRPRK